MYLFVYGTLKRGFGNHAVLRGAEYVGRADLWGYEMYSLGGFPGIVPCTGFSCVQGEVYEVSDFLSLDRLEGYNPDTDNGMYLRREVEIGWKDDEGEAPAYAYIWNREVIGRRLIASGEWK